MEEICAATSFVCDYNKSIHSRGRTPVFLDRLITEIIAAFHMFVILRNLLLVM